MSDKSTDELIQAWHRFFANKGDEEKREPNRWAVTKLRRLLHDSFLSDNEGIIDDPERAWEIILLLIDGAPFARGFSAYLMGANSKTRPELFTKFEREFEVPHFHRTVSDYFTALTQAGFTVTDLIEPELNDLLLNHSPGFHDYRGHPVGLIFACTKQ